jgi:hypothetical protein
MRWKVAVVGGEYFVTVTREDCLGLTQIERRHALTLFHEAVHLDHLAQGLSGKGAIACGEYFRYFAPQLVGVLGMHREIVQTVDN